MLLASIASTQLADGQSAPVASRSSFSSSVATYSSSAAQPAGASSSSSVSRRTYTYLRPQRAEHLGRQRGSSGAFHHHFTGGLLSPFAPFGAPLLPLPPPLAPLSFHFQPSRHLQPLFRLSNAPAPFGDSEPGAQPPPVAADLPPAVSGTQYWPPPPSSSLRPSSLSSSSSSPSSSAAASPLATWENSSSRPASSTRPLSPAARPAYRRPGAARLRPVAPPSAGPSYVAAAAPTVSPSTSVVANALDADIGFDAPVASNSDSSSLAGPTVAANSAAGAPAATSASGPRPGSASAGFVSGDGFDASAAAAAAAASSS